MARSKRGKKSTLPSAEDLHQQVATFLKEGNHAKAVDAAKRLQKFDPEGPGRFLLAQACRGWSRELAAQGQDKEAAIRLEKAAGLAPEPDDQRRLMILWLNSGNFGKGTRRFLAQEDILRRENPVLWERCASLLSLAILSGNGEVLAALPPDHPLARHQPQAQAAVEAFVAGHGANEQLRLLPARSPYRSFRLFLQALACHRDSPREADELLRRLPPGTPLEPLAAALRTVLEETGEVRKKISLLRDPSVAALMIPLAGLKPQDLQFLARLEDTTPTPSHLLRPLPHPPTPLPPPLARPPAGAPPAPDPPRLPPFLPPFG
ncbi:MAG: hypothetical protein HQL82_05530, partial [Magnetococcales bacterium]|nr:hypothetical protein [Magnetococcales bacterium]